MIDNSVIKYILSFLCNSDEANVVNNIYYGKNQDVSDKKVIIVQSNFFDDEIYGTNGSLPSLPLSEIEGVPLLFGEPRIEKKNGKVIIYGDIVASTFFLISRYEEMVRKDVRDVHGIFPGRESLPSRADFIHRPIVEEYGRILRKYMREVGIDIAEPEKGFSKIYLTHDVDRPWEHFTVYTACKRVLREIIKDKRFTLYSFKNILGNPEYDPWYTFKYLIEEDKKVKDAESIYFIKSTGYLQPQDYFPYIQKTGAKKLFKLLRSSKAILGYHVSYAAGKNTNVISSELEVLRKVLDEPITISRNHYLASLEPQDYCALIENGITDDFTMGYADIAGFRLGTCRNVKWINPYTKEMTELVLHPLNIMDNTLYEAQYLNLTEEVAREYTRKIIYNTFECNGDLCLLWHNGETNGKDNLNWNNYRNCLNNINQCRETK